MARFSFVREDDTTDVDATATAPNPDELAENQLADVSADMGEMDKEDAGLEEAVQTATAGEEMADSVGEAVESGEPMDENAADGLATATEHMFNRIGAWGRTSKMKMESMAGNFSSKKTKAQRLAAQREGWEDMKARLKKIWEAIKAAIKRAIEAVVGFFTKLFSSASGVKKRADAIVKRAEGMKEMTIGADDKVSSGSFFKALRKGNKVASEGDIDKFIEGVARNDAGDIALIPGMKIDNVKKYIEKAKETIKAVDDNAKFGKDLISSVIEFGNIVPGGKSVKGNDYVKAAPGITMYESELPLGDMSIYKLTPTSNAADTEQVTGALTQMKLTIEKSTGYKEDSKSEDVAPITSIDKCKSLAEAVSKAMAHYDGKPKIIEEIKKMGEEVNKAIEEASKKGERSDEQMKDIYKNTTVGAVLGRTCQNILTGFLSKVKHYEIITSKGVCDYVSLSLDKAKKAGAKAAEPAK